MREVETMLNNKKTEIDQIEVPTELEARLSRALKDKRLEPRRGNNLKVKAVAACFVVLLIGYNFNTLAFYGKRLMGYDTIMNGTLKQLNELGKGQVIGKSYTFKNGVSITLEGIMIDENQLLAFYSIKDPNGAADAITMDLYIKGLSKTYMMQNGQGEAANENKEIKWIMSFEAPRFYEKKLELRAGLSDRDTREEGEIAFKLDRDKAMGHTLKKNINKTFKVNQTKIRLESITASPTKTVINGSIQNTFELAKDQLMGERIRPNNKELKLIANGKAVASQGGGQSTNLDGIKFQEEFDALPRVLKSLEIHLVSLSIDRDVDEEINLDKKNEDKSFKIEGQNLEINKIYEEKGNTFITITTEEGTILTRVYLSIDGNKTELEKTLEGKLNKEKDGTILHTRTMCFPKTGKEYKLIIERMTYTEAYDKVIDIPIN